MNNKKQILTKRGMLTNLLISSGISIAWKEKLTYIVLVFTIVSKWKFAFCFQNICEDNLFVSLQCLVSKNVQQLQIRSTSKKPQLLGLHDLCWIGVIQNYLKSIDFPEFVYDRLSDLTKNLQSTNDIVHEW